VNDLPSYDKVIPDDISNRLQALADTGDATEYAIGDMCEEVFSLFWDDIKAECPAATKKWLYTGIADRCGRSWETVRMYHYVSKHVPPDVRDDYPSLSRNHHKAMIPHAAGDPAKHRDLCEWWLTKADEYGGSVGGVTALRAALPSSGKASNLPVWVLRARRLLTAAEALQKEPTSPPAVVDLMDRLIKRWQALEEAKVVASEHVEQAEAEDRRPPE
jgi:hypothetical protein